MGQSFKLLQGAMIAALLVIGLGVHAASDDYKGLELPPYRVLERDGSFELRDYAPHVVAEVRVAGDRGQSVRRGFRVLAGYLFGDNATGEALEMTAPVSQVRGDDAWTVRFLIPSAFSLRSLPEPSNAAIRLVETPPVRHFVLRFSSRATEKILARQTKLLLDELRAHGLEAAGPVHYHYYDDPFTLPRNRRNEVSVPVR